MRKWVTREGHPVVGMESTGAYGTGLRKALRAAAVETVWVNPMHTARFKDLVDNHPAKNDPKDAVVIAELVARGMYQAPVERTGGYETLFRHSQSLSRVLTEMTRLANRRHAVAHGLEVTAEEAEWMKEDLTRLGKREKALKRALVKALDEVPYGGIWKRMRGLGAVTFARILGETGDLRGYRSVRQVVALAGLSLTQAQSGQFAGRTRLTKRGRPEVRRQLYLAALRMVKTGGIYRTRYEGALKRNPAKVAALVGLSRALLRRLVAEARAFPAHAKEVTR